MRWNPCVWRPPTWRAFRQNLKRCAARGCIRSDSPGGVAAGLAADPHPPDMARKPALAVNAKLDVYPNVAEPAPWWRLGNLQHDGVAGVMQTYCEEMTEGMRILRELPVSALARRYGQPASTRLYTRSDLIARWLHQWGAEHSTVA